jgi:hypothetical protein
LQKFKKDIKLKTVQSFQMTKRKENSQRSGRENKKLSIFKLVRHSFSKRQPSWKKISDAQ